MKEAYLMRKYDRANPKEKIISKKQIDNILNSFEKVKYKDLDSQYLEETKTGDDTYKKILKNHFYYVVKGEAIFKHIAEGYRIKDLMPKDFYYRRHIMKHHKDGELLWLMDKELLYKIIELQQELKRKKLNHKGFRINSGFRHPIYNEQVGGASKSRHIRGQAVDISVEDIDWDGKISKEDKAIVLEILEKKVIGSKGGIGKYPKTQTIHFDVRGYKARWNSY